MYQLVVRVLASLPLVALLSGVAIADSQEILIDDVWARATVGASRPGVVYLSLRNTGGIAVNLTAIRTDIAARAEAHISETDANGVSTMRPAGIVAIRAGTNVDFAPGGLHIMLMDLVEPLVEGETFELDLVFDDGGILTVSARVRGIAATGPRD